MARPNTAEIKRRVLKRAGSDPNFRQRLLTEPLDALREVVGHVPEGLRIRFIEKSPDLDALIVLPEAGGAKELTDEELDHAAGGEGQSWASFDDDDTL